MAVLLVLSLLALQTAHGASIPPASSEITSLEAGLDTPEAAADGRQLDVGDAPIALLIGKDVKRVARRKGSPEGKFKVRRHKQHKNLDSHLLESREWSHQDSELDHLLDPMSLEDPKDIELKKAIAQLIKEVADREEKRKRKQHLHTYEVNIGSSEDADSQKDLNVKIEHSGELDESQEYVSNEDIEENRDEVDDQDDVSDVVEDFGESEYQSESIVDDDSSRDFESPKSHDDIKDGVSHEVNDVIKKKESLIRDDEHYEKHHNVQQFEDDDLENKVHHHGNRNRHVSNESVEDNGDNNNLIGNVNNFHSHEETKAKFIDDVDEEKLKHDGSNENENQNKNENDHKHHDHKKNYHHQENLHDIDASHNDDEVMINEIQVDNKSQKIHDNDMKSTEQKDNEKHNDFAHKNSGERILDEENNVEEDTDFELDQTKEYDDSNSKDSKQFSLEDYDSHDKDDGDEKEQLKEVIQKIVDQSSNDGAEVTNKRVSDDDSSKPEIENDTHQNALSPKLRNVTDDDKDNKDSVEIRRYHLLPQRYRSRQYEKISRSYPAGRNGAPIKHYTLSFFLRK